MSKKGISTLSFIALTLVSVSAQAFTAADVTSYNPGLKKIVVEEHKFPLFPKEKGIENFPEAIPEDETDLNILEQYYRDVATAYWAWAEKNEKQAHKQKEAMHHMQNKLYLHTMRTSRHDQCPGERSINQARVRSIQYMKQRFVPSHFNSESAQKKAEFYEAVADTCAELAVELKE